MKVNIYTHERENVHPDKPPRWMVLAYTRYQGEGACVHNIPDALTGAQAKRAAIKEHRERCLPRAGAA